METSRLILTAVLPIFCVIAAGYGARRIKWLTPDADRSLMQLVVNLLYPALIFSFILGNEALRQPANILLPPLIGFISIAIGIYVTLYIARRLKIGDDRECRTFGFTTGIYNYGYFPIPIIALLFDRETTGVLLVHNVGVEIAMWALGVGCILSANDPKPIWRRMLSPPVIAILIAVPLNLLRIDTYIPQFIPQTIELLGQCAIPLGLILIGATFSDLTQGVQLLTRPHVPIIASILRMGIFPIFFLLTAALLPLSIELERVLLIQAAMPCAVFPIVLARHYNGSPQVALKTVLSTTLVSFITIPIWISIGLKMLEI